MIESNAAVSDSPKKSEQTRQKIMDVFIDLMQGQDFLSIKVKTIVEKAQITRGTFYLYFSNTSDLITSIEEELLDDLPEILPYTTNAINPFDPPSYEVVHDDEWETAWFQYYMEHQKALNALIGPHGDHSFYIRICNYLKEAISCHMKRDSMPEDAYQGYFLNLLPDIFLMLSKEWTSDTNFQKIGLDSIVAIVSTIRIGSMYRRYLELQNGKKP
ncbi:MAG: TetR/AcrR family transcriptional regulator [Blautia sp.]|nr:TetR/AcrR family transcriptional regulator [Blautia sp.]